MFSVGDRVISIYFPNKIGTVRAKYRHHYLISWEGRKKYGRFTHEQDSRILLANSPLVPKITQIHKELQHLDNHTYQLEKELKGFLLKGGDIALK